jgi:putative ABC transport system ATP-binding protein
VLDLLCRQAREQGAACLIVTHSATAAARADRVLELDVRGVRSLGTTTAGAP